LTFCKVGLMSVAVPTSLADALALLAENPSATVLAGGTDYMVETNFGHRTPSDVVALRRVHELSQWTHDPSSGTVTIGSSVPYAQMEHGPLAGLLPALAEAARTVGSPQIRAAGTLGGNLGTCSPAGDGLPVLSALDATVHMASHDGQRSLSVHEFMTGVKRNALVPGELITAVTVPVLDGWQGYAKVGVRNAMVIAVASACLAHDRTGGTVRLALGAVGPTVIRCREAEAWLAGAIDLTSSTPVTAEVADEFARRAAEEARPIDDHRSTAAYRRHAVQVLATRSIRRALPA
jgi:CO/xanthine dehydrogenase FAD-binding subunit